MKPSEILRSLEQHPSFSKHAGICSNFKWVSDGEYLVRCMNKHGICYSDWPLFSGSYSYPVASTKPEYTHSEAYTYLNKWRKRSKYGAARRELLKWLIEQFEAKGE